MPVVTLKVREYAADSIALVEPALSKKTACSACGTEPLKTKKTVNFFSGRTQISVNQNQETTHPC
jgi:hypothetical protein